MPSKIVGDEPSKPKTRVQMGKVVRSVAVDPVDRARTRKKLHERRATGFTSMNELVKLSLIDKRDIELLRKSSVEEKDGMKPLRESKIMEQEEEGEDMAVDLEEQLKMARKLSHAREVYRMNFQEHLKDEQHIPCPHPDTWCTCEQRLVGSTSTFVDSAQPPYTIWHAGSDYVSPKKETFDKNGELQMIPVQVFNMTGEGGFCVQITNYGARIVSILMPDHDGIVEEVMLSFPNVELLQRYEDLYMYGLMGRVTGSVTEGVLLCKGVDAQLELNDGNDHLNGGTNDAGFDRVVWQAAVAGNELVFTLLSRDGTAGYPGSALLTARYCVRPPNTLVFRLTATCTKPCPFLPALRLPFNLAGHGAGKMGMLEHVVTVNAAHYLVTDDEQKPTGKERHVAGTIQDMRIPRMMKHLHPRAPWPGFRTYYRLSDTGQYSPSGDASRPGEADDEDAPLPFAAKLYHPDSRRAVEIRTNQPVLYFETVRMSLPVDPEDQEEEDRRKWEKRRKEVDERRKQEAQAAAERAALAAADAATRVAEGEEGDEFHGEDEEGAEDMPVKTRFGGDDIRVVEEYGEDTPPQTAVQGRGRFLYCRCCAVTVQPQADPLIKPKPSRGPIPRPMDVSKLVLRPGRQLLYAMTLRFYLEEPLPKPRRRRGEKVRYVESDERMDDVRARFDECNVDAEMADWRRAQAMSWAARNVTSMESMLPRDLKDMLWADRCSLESLVTGVKRFDRVFLGPPSAEVPEPQRREFPSVDNSPVQSPPSTRRSRLYSTGKLGMKKEKQKGNEEKENEKKKRKKENGEMAEKEKEKEKEKETANSRFQFPRKRPFGYSPA